ncbi:MAG: hypothetical protein LWW93_01065 [Hyphomicrobiales bacterium]|nr:hypothetical protein [Hyphomicrobiales bacterium]
MRALRLSSLATFAAAAILLAFAGVAEAQSQGGRGGGSGGGSGGGDADNGDLVLYGTPGNCPPTRDCGTRRPPRTVGVGDPCSRWEVVTTRTGRHIRVCRDN